MKVKYIPEISIPVLDKGFVELIDYLGDDLTVVNSARVSFMKRKHQLDNKDIKLMKFLYENEHHSPYRHPQIQLHIKAPEAVARQIWKHCVGITGTSKERHNDTGWNEASRRYVTIDDYYTPDFFRYQSKNSKQASVYDENGNPLKFPEDKEEEFRKLWLDHEQKTRDLIDYFIDQGMAKEQAQMKLSLDFYTEWYWTASFQALAHLVDLRADNHAQWEAQQYGLAIQKILFQLFPNTSEVWFNEQ